MSHHRQAVRDAVATALTGLATTGANVAVGRVYPVALEEMPYLLIYTPREEMREEIDIMVHPTAGAFASERSLELLVVAYAAGDGYLAVLDQIAREVEQALAADLSLGGVCDAIWPAEATYEQTPEVEVPAGVLSMTYRADYRVDGRDPAAQV